MKRYNNYVRKYRGYKLKIIREDRRVNQNRDFEINSIDGIPRIFSGKDFSVVFEREEALCLVKELMDCSFLNPWLMIFANRENGRDG